MQVNVNRVETDEEVAEDVLLGLGDGREQGGDDGLARGELRRQRAPTRGLSQLTSAPTESSSFMAFASTSPTSTPPSLCQRQLRFHRT